MDKNSWIILLLKQFWIFWLIIILVIIRIIPFYHSLIAYFLFCLYHRLTSTTEILYTKNFPMEEIIKKSKLESLKFKPSFFFPITPLQFINLSRSKVKPKYKISVERNYIGNNGVCLDWIKYEGINNKDNPILIIIPGLTGSIDDPYVINLANESILNGGYNTCIYQMRLLTDRLKIEKPYLFLLDDLDEMLDELRKEYGENKKIYIVGYSYGAIQLVKYLGQKNNIKKKITAAVSISNPFECIISSRLRLNKLYDRLLVTFMQEVVSKNGKNVKNLNLNIDAALNTNQFKVFDQYYTSQVFGYKTADEYYRNVSCVNEIKNINIPLLCINAKDDQISFEESIPYDDIKLNKNVALLLTSHGTHSGFIENNGLFGVRQWIPKPALSFLKVFDQ